MAGLQVRQGDHCMTLYLGTNPSTNRTNLTFCNFFVCSQIFFLCQYFFIYNGNIMGRL
eukprot:UN07215